MNTNQSEILKILKTGKIYIVRTKDSFTVTVPARFLRKSTTQTVKDTHRFYYFDESGNKSHSDIQSAISNLHRQTTGGSPLVLEEIMSMTELHLTDEEILFLYNRGELKS